MKKFNAFVASAACVASLVAPAAFAAPMADAQLGGAYLAVAPLTRDINIAEQANMLAMDNRAGFVKNDFTFTISANVVLAVEEDNVNNRFGVVSGSNKGYTAFTGSSVGGSIAQCGDPVPKAEPNLAASLVVADTLDMDEANGCGR